jgi:D-glycero-D-manno-heptose 1,7-bisphosphate phosphatase
MNQQKCLFLDRDGVINTDIAYAYKPEDIEFVPGIFELCKTLQNKGYLIIIVTNQSGIARRFYSENDFHHLTAWMTQVFAEHGIIITDTFFCPHHPSITGKCNCRKPAPGMLLEAIKKYPIAPQFSIMVGDKASDMQAADAAGITTRVLFNTQITCDTATHTVSTLNEIIDLSIG